jgi:hypothetical protein
MNSSSLATGMLSSRFRYGKSDELADPAGSVVRGISHLDYRWKALHKRIERPRITGEIAADKIGRSRPVTKIDAEWLVGGSCDLQDVRHGGIGTQPRIARHGVRITVRDHKDLTGLERNRLSVSDCGIAMACRDDVIGNQVIGIGQNLRSPMTGLPRSLRFVKRASRILHQRSKSNRQVLEQHRAAALVAEPLSKNNLDQLERSQ